MEPQDPDQTNWMGKTALSQAADNHQVEIMRILLQAMAHVNQTDEEGDLSDHFSKDQTDQTDNVQTHGTGASPKECG